MHLLRFISFFVLAAILVNTSDAQVKKSRGWKSPTFTIDIAPNYSLPLQETKGANIGEFFTFKNYGTKLGWGASFNFKFGLGPQGQYRPYLSLGYSQFQAKDDNNSYIPRNIIDNGYPLRNDSVFNNPVAGKSELFLRIPYIGAGFEYAITTVDRKKRMWYPHIGVEMLLSVITGIYRQNSPNVQIEPNVETGYTIKSDVRVGLGAGLGATIRFGKRAGITFGGKYKLFNLIGKKSDFLKEENKMNLLDKAATDLNANLSKDRNIGALELYLGATIFLGKTKK
ncbi:MAG: hypothetical protein N2510_05330 [Ignavibacteria bacterium]|nr:hypothetical protein [Ignavibacteria bacterium]